MCVFLNQVAYQEDGIGNYKDSDSTGKILPPLCCPHDAYDINNVCVFMQTKKKRGGHIAEYRVVPVGAMK